MTTTTVNFSFPQRFQTDFPSIEVEVNFSGSSEVGEDTTFIKSLFISQEFLERGVTVEDQEPKKIRLPIPESNVGQYWAKGKMGELLAKCRFHAQQELYRQEKLQAEINEDLKSNHKHNADFWPRASNTRYMNEQ